MQKIRRPAIVALAFVLVAGVLIYSARRPDSSTAIVGVGRATEVRVEPEVNGQLVSIAVEKGTHVRAGDILAKLSAVELTAQADQARAALASAAANRNNVYAGVRREQVDSLKAAIAKASARLDYVQAQLTRTSTLARQSFESQQSLDQAENDVASARADVAGGRGRGQMTMRGRRARHRRTARSPTHRCRPRPRRSLYSSAVLTRWSCALRPTVWSALSQQKWARMFAPANRS